MQLSRVWPFPVTPAKAGVRRILKILDSRLRGNDVKGLLFMLNVKGLFSMKNEKD